MSGSPSLLNKQNYRQEIKALMESFYDFQIVDLRRAERTAKEKIWYIRRFLEVVGRNPLGISNKDVSARIALESLNSSV